MKNLLWLILFAFVFGNLTFGQEPKQSTSILQRLAALEKTVKELQQENKRLRAERVIVKRGEYTGNGGADRLIELGFKPNLVLWHLKTDDSGKFRFGIKAGFCLSEQNGMGIAQSAQSGTKNYSNDWPFVTIADDGFVVNSIPDPNYIYYGGANIKDVVYVYVAVK